MVAEVARLFVALPLTDDARHAMSRMLLRAAPGGLPGRVVRPDNWHVTLRFLGDVEAVDRDRLSASLASADLGPRFAVRWGRLGAFPKPQRATVLWIGMDAGARETEMLAGEVEDAVRAAGFEAEDRPFRAHLTLSRIRPQRDVATLLDAVEPLGLSMPADRVVLYRSHLGRGGARYEVLEEFLLG